MNTIKKVTLSVLLAVLTLPVYAYSQGGVYLSLSPGITYSAPVYSSYCLQWVPQQVDEYNNWVPGHYVNVCYYQPYPYTYYYGYGFHGNGNGHHHHHDRD